MFALETKYGLVMLHMYPGLPDFSWYILPRLEKMYIQNEYKMFQMVIKYPL
jgi:hypothetical protein